MSEEYTDEELVVADLVEKTLLRIAELTDLLVTNQTGIALVATSMVEKYRDDLSFNVLCVGLDSQSDTVSELYNTIHELAQGIFDISAKKMIDGLDLESLLLDGDDE